MEQYLSVKNINKFFGDFQALKNVSFNVKEGEFGAFMKVELINDGPVTILLESKNGKLLN